MKPSGVRTTPFSSRLPCWSPTAVERRQHVAGELRCLGKALDGPAAALAARQRRDLAEAGDLGELEAHIGERRRIVGHGGQDLPGSMTSGIERLFHAAHQFDLDRRFVMRELADLEPTDAVLGANRAVARFTAMSWTMRLSSGCSARNAALSACSGWWML